MTCNLGDKAYKRYEKEMQKDLEREEEQEDKIRKLAKERNAKERNRNRRNPTAPAAKRRKMETGFESKPESHTTTEAEKRKAEE